MSEKVALVPTLGQWVDGERFWNSEHEIARFVELLDEGASISLLAPRRVGKTSLMHEVARRVQNRYTCLQIDLESSRTPDEALAEIVHASAPYPNAGMRVRRAFKATLGLTREIKIASVELKLREQLPGRWERRGTELLRELAKLDKPPVIFIDEVPIFVYRLMCQGHDVSPTSAGLREAERFLDWLRHTVHTLRSDLRIVITGSIGMGPLLERYGWASRIDCFTPLEMRPWDQATARGCLQALARHRGIWFESESDARAVELLGTSTAYHIQLFFDRLCEFARRQKKTQRAIFPKDVERIYREQMLGPKCRNSLMHYDTRLGQVFSKVREDFAREVLARLAVEQSIPLASVMRLGDELGVDAADRVMVVQVLEHDGYVTCTAEEERACQFASNYLRDWWRLRYPLSVQSEAEER